MSSTSKRSWTRYLVPGFIFQSVVIGGGYGTGAEIAQYFGVTTDYLLGVASGKTVDVSNLTDSQINTIHQLIAEFNKAVT